MTAGPLWIPNARGPMMPDPFGPFLHEVAMSPRRTLSLAGALFLGLLVAVPSVAAQEPGGDKSSEWLVATAVLAAPPQYRADAEVRAWTDDGALVTLREGSNGLICLADRPGDDQFQAACYHDSLEPFMARGRELAAAGIEGNERNATRWREAEAGTLPLPEQAAMVYNLGFPGEDISPDVDPATGGRLHAVYMPYASAESTGLPVQPSADAPWLMFPGEPSAHIMISLPRAGG